MSRRYSIEDLLKLRASPLICRPPGLRPNEEWMGSQEQATKRPTTRGRQEDGSLQPEGVQKRANYDPSQRRQTADPERIVLGPPRRSFASSNGRPFSKHGTQDSEDSTRDRHHERTRTGDDGDPKFGERRGFGGQNGRFGNRQDQDSTYHEHSRRRRADEDADGRNHREYDRPKWGTKPNRDETAFDEDNIDSSGLRSGLRRDQGRSKFEQPWFRGDKGGEDGQREKERGSGWRNNKSRDGDWDIPSKTEIDPEWMDSVDNSEPFQAHTQEDFQKWKERMKAGNAASGQKVEQATPSATLGVPSEAQSAFAAPSPSIISPDPSGNSMDKFFARFNEKKAATDEQTVAKPAAKTRFASLFSPPPEVKAGSSQSQPDVPVDTTSTTSPPPLSSQAPPHDDADQAGFQRILQMLGKKEGGFAMQMDGGQQSKPSPVLAVRSHQRNASPDLLALLKQDQPTRRTPSSQAIGPPPGLERLVNSKSPEESQSRHSNTPNKDELLLNLLRQAEISTKPQPQQPYMENRGIASQFGAPDLHRAESRTAAEHDRVQTHNRGGARSMFDDPAISSMSYPGEMRARDGQQRGPPNGAPPGFEDAYLEAQRSNGSQPKSMHSMPPGLQRPPGLDQMLRMPSGFNQQQGPHGAPPQHRPGPPPGLNSRNMAPFGNPQQPPPPPMPQQHSGQAPPRPPPQRKYTGDSGLPNFPPGMGPPPGFMNHGPPPGFQHANAAQAAQNYGRFAMGGNEPGSQQQGPPPPNMSRAFMEMYGNDRGGMRSGGGGGGGVPMPPGFR